MKWPRICTLKHNNSHVFPPKILNIFASVLIIRIFCSDLSCWLCVRIIVYKIPASSSDKHFSTWSNWKRSSIVSLYHGTFYTSFFNTILQKCQICFHIKTYELRWNNVVPYLTHFPYKFRTFCFWSNIINNIHIFFEKLLKCFLWQ